MKKIVKGLEETEYIASKIAKLLKGGDIILLNGNLGTGKTTFTKFLGKHLGIKENIISPTFNLLKTYKCADFNLVHIDAYRLEGSCFDEIYDYLAPDCVLVVEWSNYLANQDDLKNNLTINISYLDENSREFEFIANSNRAEMILRGLE